jgi:vacuolar-type H+-ATPase catalytic subunit A/Vma1
MKQTLLLIAAVAARKVFWTRVEELLDNVNKGLDEAQTYIEEEIQPQIETMEAKSQDIVDTSTEM